MILDKKSEIIKIFQNEFELFKKSHSIEDKWSRLERMHILGQMYFVLHFQVHLLMLILAIKQINLKEALGQVLRLALVTPGHIFQRLPKGNVGTTRVSAFAPMAVPEDLKSLLN